MTGPILATAHSIQPALPVKASYLVSLTQKNKHIFFITIDKVDYGVNTISVKGFFTEKDLDDIVNNYQALIKEADREKILEITFPLTKIDYIRSLVFKAK